MFKINISLILCLLLLVGIKYFTQKDIPLEKPITTIIPSVTETVIEEPKALPPKKELPKPIIEEIKPPIVVEEKPKPLPPRYTNARNVKLYIPDKAFDYIDLLKSEVDRILPNFPYPHYFGALIEHESCIHLKHRRCWDATSQLKTSRELGIGYFQITKAFRKDGSLRFDTLTDLKRKYSKELHELTWENIKLRPELQIRAGLLLSKRNYSQLYNITSDYSRLALADAAYNGGLRSVNQRRRKCSLIKKCNDQLWFGNNENMIVKSTKPLYGGRSAQQINTEHVHDVLKTRMAKYKPLFEIR